MPGYKPTPVRERIAANTIVRDDGCWEWQLSLDNKGYGQMTVGSKADGTRRNKKAYRVAYETFIGPVPAGLELDHLCRNRACVNPEHLEPVSHRENLLRGEGWTAVNARKTCCSKCGGDYTRKWIKSEARWERRCARCKQAHNRKYRDRAASGAV